MRKVELNLYSYEELSDEAKIIARDIFVTTGKYPPENWTDSFLNVMWNIGVQIFNYRFDNSTVTIKYLDDATSTAQMILESYDSEHPLHVIAIEFKRNGIMAGARVFNDGICDYIIRYLAMVYLKITTEEEFAAYAISLKYEFFGSGHHFGEYLKC